MVEYSPKILAREEKATTSNNNDDYLSASLMWAPGAYTK